MSTTLAKAKAERDELPGRPELGRRLLIPLALGLAVLLGLALLADARELARQVRDFEARLLLPVLALSVLNYALRFLRWQLYLRVLEVKLPVSRSLGVFVFGFVLSVTPGKAGELGKAWLVRELGGGPARRTVSAVLAERFTDLLGVVLLVAMGAARYPGGGWVALVGGGLCGVALLLLAWPGAALATLKRLGSLPLLGPRTQLLEDIYLRLRRLMAPAILTVSLLLAVVAWGAEGVGFFLVVGHYQPDVGLAAAIFDYSFATLVGALTMLPGGLVASEGTMTALLGAQGLDLAAAASATLITRAATLWFAVGLGLATLPWVSRAVAGAAKPA
jgi:uncharacterized membrane protein YbhN (UPF0104 family)